MKVHQVDSGDSGSEAQTDNRCLRACQGTPNVPPTGSPEVHGMGNIPGIKTNQN